MTSSCLLFLNFRLWNFMWVWVHADFSRFYFKICKIMCCRTSLLHWLFLNHWEVLFLFCFYFKLWCNTYTMICTYTSFNWLLFNIQCVFFWLFDNNFFLQITLGCISLSFFEKIWLQNRPIMRLPFLDLLLRFGVCVWDIRCA